MPATKTAEALRRAIAACAVEHVPFDGFSETTLELSAKDAGVAPEVARQLFPRAGLDLAIALHESGDRTLAQALATWEPLDMRFRDRINYAVKRRIEAGDREVIRRATVLFSLPHNSADGARLIWNTSDLIWTNLGDRSNDLNWYTKRATLSGIYSATLLYWLGDDSPGTAASWDFLDRRIADVMAFEKIKARARDHALTAPLMRLHTHLSGLIHAPNTSPQEPIPDKIPAKPQTSHG